MSARALSRSLRPAFSIARNARFASTLPGIVTELEQSIPGSTTVAEVNASEEPWPSEAESLELISNLPSKSLVGSSADPSDPSSFVHLQLNNLVPRAPSAPRASRSVLALPAHVFAHPLRPDILHACVVHHLDGLRKGLAKSKSRYEVSASNHKLRPQKGSGRARLRDAGSPMLRGGGRAWPKIPRDFSTLLNRKVREMGMRVVLSAKLREHLFEVVPSIRAWTSRKTGDLDRRMKTKGWASSTDPKEKTLFVVGGDGPIPKNLELASRNLQHAHVVRAKELNVYDALWWKRLVLDVDAVDYFIETLGRESRKKHALNLAPRPATSFVGLGSTTSNRTGLLPLHTYFPLFTAPSSAHIHA